MFKKKYDLHYPYTYEEASSLDIFAWFKMISIPTFTFFFLTFYFNEVMRDVLPELAQKYSNELSVFAGMIFLLANIAGLEWATKDNWKLLFKKVAWKDIKTVLIYTFSAYILSVIFGMFFKNTSPINPHVTTNFLDYAMNLFGNIFQLLGEEFIAILPFLALISLGKYLKWNATLTTILALILSSIVFGIAHTWTYGGVLNGITNTFIGRTVITLTFIKTKNIWVSYFTHFLYDFGLLTLALFFV